MGPRAQVAASLEELLQLSSRRRPGMLSGERREAAAPRTGERREEEGAFGEELLGLPVRLERSLVPSPFQHLVSRLVAPSPSWPQLLIALGTARLLLDPMEPPSLPLARSVVATPS